MFLQICKAQHSCHASVFSCAVLIGEIWWKHKAYSVLTSEYLKVLHCTPDPSSSEIYYPCLLRTMPPVYIYTTAALHIPGPPACECKCTTSKTWTHHCYIFRWIITPTYLRCGFLSSTIAIAWIRAMSFACSSLTLTVWDINKKWAYHRLIVLQKHWTDNIEVTRIAVPP
jgi:hypothetical protein